jgi:hypothetical protein
MCNLNILVNNKGKDNVDLLLYASAASFADNSDSEGMYLSEGNVIVKSENKIPIHEYREQIKNSDVVITHQRISTSGHDMDNCQPFVNDRFVVVHNGIFGINASISKKSDTCLFFEAFNKFYDLSSEKHYDKKMRDSIEKSVKEVDGGSYSVLIYDIEMKRSFYFKNSSTSINILKLKNGAYFITTSVSNKSFLNEEYTNYECNEDIMYCFKHEEPGSKEEFMYWDLGKLDIPYIGYYQRKNYHSYDYTMGRDTCLVDVISNSEERAMEVSLNKYVDEMTEDYQTGAG